ncbi:DotH/IcmK family type IV secretion protein, partial [Fangia hongkongensis]
NTNMAVMLKGRKTPVTVMLLSTQKKWDYEVYIRVLSAKDNHFDIKGSTYLIDLLSGIAPSGAKRLSLSANSMNARLWEYHGNYLLLTRSVLISPSYIHHIEDNTLGQINVYEIAKTPVIILSGGKGMQKVMVKDDS